MEDASAGKPRVLMSRSLSAFAVELRCEAIPDGVRKTAKLLMLDALGVAFAAAKGAFATTALRAMASLGSGDSPVFGHPTRLGLRDAVFMNGLLIHGLDYDDTYLPGSVHLTASCVPPALIVGERMSATGADVLAATVVGMEAVARLAHAARGGFLRAGSQATGILGTFGSCLATGHLLRLSPDQLTQAQGIALSFAAGNMQPVVEGAWSKRLHPGWAAAAGVLATVLAEQGYLGVDETYEGEFGVFRSFAREQVPQDGLEGVTDGLGESWQFAHATIKAFPACQQSQPCMQAVLALKSEHGFSGRDVRTIHAKVPDVAIPLVCEPTTEKYAPKNSYAAQFSLPYALACCAIRGQFTVTELDDSSFRDAELLGLARRVTCSADPHSRFPEARSGEVTIVLTDGTRLSRREEIGAGEPLSELTIREKFRANVHPSMGEARASEVYETVLGLEDVADAAVLTALLGASE